MFLQQLAPYPRGKCLSLVCDCTFLGTFSEVFVAGEDKSGLDGWPADGWQRTGGDVAVFKLDQHQLSMRSQRLGQTFTMPTLGFQNLRIHVCFGRSTQNRVQVARAEPHEHF